MLKFSIITINYNNLVGLEKTFQSVISQNCDFAEYLIRKDSGFTKEDVFRRMEDPSPQYGAALLADGSSHILLLHAHDETEEIVPEYYKLFIERLLEKGVVFEKPEFSSFLIKTTSGYFFCKNSSVSSLDASSTTITS